MKRERIYGTDADRIQGLVVASQDLDQEALHGLFDLLNQPGTDAIIVNAPKEGTVVDPGASVTIIKTP